MIKILLRTGIVSGLLVGAALVIYWQMSGWWHFKAIEQRDRIIAEMTERIARKEAMIERLGRSRRMAVIDVPHQTLDADGRALETRIRLIEIDDDGRELGRQEFLIRGGVLFVDTWTVKFPHDQVAEGHPFHGRSLVLLRRVYSDQMPPRDGFRIDTPGAIPDGYAASDVADFEKRLWSQFWEIAADPDAAKRFGVRVAQGEAVYKPVRAGQRFELAVDAAGGINLIPVSSRDRVATGALK